jgi:hypothetical protein
MKMAIRLVLANVIALQLLAGVTAAGARWRILGIPLDMPIEEELDGQYLEGLYQGDYGTHLQNNYGGYIAGHLKDSLLRELPFYHMNSTMKDGRQLELWFSTNADGRKIFGVELHEVFEGKRARDPAAATRDAEAAFGKPDRVIASPAVPGQTILLFVDPGLPKEKRDAVIARLPQGRQMPQEDVDKFSRTDLRERVRILGPDFRGAVVTFYGFKGKVTGSDVELLDLQRARTVFNLEQAR